MTQASVPAMLLRGGTSKGVYLRRSALPDDRDVWDDLLLSAFGSPDPKQVDGVGGSHSTASKAMVVSAADEDGVDVEYLFAQVGVEKPVVDWGGNCGNLTYAVGPFALETGLVRPGPGRERVELVLRNANTDAVVEQSVPTTADGTPRYDGEFTVHGVPRPGARIESRFQDPAGAVTGAAFPTGNRTDRLRVDGLGAVDVSLVDVANPCAFVRADDVGLTATETPVEIDGDPSTLERLERLRGAAAVRLGLVDDPAAATVESPGLPKLVVVGERAAYHTSGGDRVGPGEFDLLARMLSMQKAHHAYAVTGAMCTAAAAALGGTVPAEFLDDPNPAPVVIGHPKGTLAVGLDRDGDAVRTARVDRTARKLMAGDLFYRPPSAEG